MSHAPADPTLPPRPPDAVAGSETVAHSSDSVAANGLPALPGHEILAELGRGGMGVVYKGRHVRLNRLVAVKMILAGGYASEAEVARFMIEAEAIAAVQHPNVVQIFETGTHDGRPYLTL